jgi:hypothetical protein
MLPSPTAAKKRGGKPFADTTGRFEARPLLVDVAAGAQR